MEYNEAKLESRVARARKATDKKLCPSRYSLGRGGFDPFAECPTDKANRCDCSGFVAWAIWLSRKPKASRPWWIETTRIFRDATTERDVFVQIPEAVPGCIVVYGDSGGKQGHTGIVTKVSGKKITGVDCSVSKNGLTERDLSWMLKRGAIFCALKGDLA